MTHEFKKGMPTDPVKRMLAINLIKNWCEKHDESAQPFDRTCNDMEVVN